MRIAQRKLFCAPSIMCTSHHQQNVCLFLYIFLERKKNVIMTTLQRNNFALFDLKLFGQQHVNVRALRSTHLTWSTFAASAIMDCCDLPFNRMKHGFV